MRRTQAAEGAAAAAGADDGAEEMRPEEVIEAFACARVRALSARLQSCVSLGASYLASFGLGRQLHKPAGSTKPLPSPRSRLACC